MNGVFTSFNISTSALKAQRTRMNVIANNMANVNTTQNDKGENIPYRRQMALFSTGAKETTGSEKYGVKAMIAEDKRDFNRVYDPSHPDGDKDGYVLKPNIDVSTEMVNMIEASRTYEANIASIDVAKNMISNTLEILA